jgi:hypothetical protein
VGNGIIASRHLLHPLLLHVFFFWLEIMEEGRGCCGDQQCWMPESILVPNGETTVDIAPTLVDNNDQYACLRTRQDSLRVIFSTDSYPPVWDQRKIIEDAVIQAAAETNNPLIRTGTKHIGGEKPHHISTLGCKFSISYQHNKKRKDPYSVGENAEPQYRDGVRQDPIVGKKSRNRDHGRQKARRTVTTKLPSEEVCHFHVRLALYPGEFWCIEPWTGNRQHRNHPRLGWDELRRPMATLPQTDRDNGALYSRFASNGAARNILYEQTQCTLSDGQLRHNNKKVETINGTLPRMDGDINSGISGGAHDLILYLQKQQRKGELSFIAVYHEIDNTSFVTIKKADEKRNREQQQELFGGTAQQKTETESTTEVSISTHSTDASGNNTSEKVLLTSEEQFQLGASLSTIRDRLKVGQKILLALAWVRTDERRLFEMFPEIFMLDVTHGTNIEARPLAVSASIDAYMETFTPVRAFLPSECQWVFHWLWASAIPSLLGHENIRRIQLVLSDGDSKIYIPFDSLKDILYPSAIHGLCGFHLILQALQKLRMLGKEKLDVKMMIKT